LKKQELCFFSGAALFLQELAAIEFMKSCFRKGKEMMQ